MRKRWNGPCRYCGSLVTFVNMGSGATVPIETTTAPVAVREGEGDAEIITIDGKKIKGERLIGLSHKEPVHIGNLIHRCRELEEQIARWA